MMLKCRKGLAVLLVGVSLTTQVLAQERPPSPTAVQRAEFWNTDQFVFYSAILDRDLLIQVVKPLMARGKVPAVYLLDGNLYTSFALNPMMGAVPGEYAPAYFIGVGYVEQSPLQWFRQRVTDLTHNSGVDLEDPITEGVPSGGGALYQRFLVEELRPAMEARYPLDAEQALLAGVSLGGVFATRVLIDQPDAFDGYLIGSPSIWADPDLLARARSTPLRAGTRIFISAGAAEEAEHLGTATALAEALRENASGVAVTEWIVPDEGHMGFAPAFFSHALKAVLPPGE